MFYEYECPNCGRFEEKQSINDDAFTKCSQCGDSIYRVIHCAEVIWKGKFRWMKFNPEVDMDKVEARERRHSLDHAKDQIKEGVKQLRG